MKNPLAGIFLVGRVVARVKHIFERIDDATIYIPSFKDCYPTPTLTISDK
ncbi:MAG: hypothetical protein WCQ60_00605 [bacterium]